MSENKNEYITPKVKVITLTNEQCLLSGSIPGPDEGELGNGGFLGE